MTCAVCGHDNREGAKFCRECAARLAASISCPKCGTPSERGQKFCDACGTAIATSHKSKAQSQTDPRPANLEPRAYTPKHLANKILTSRSTLEGERKQVTVLFADVKGSMDLAEQQDRKRSENCARICSGTTRV